MTSLSKGNGDFSMPWLAVLLVFVWLGIFNTVMAAENQPPSATGQALSTKEDTKKSITLSGKDPEKKKLTYAIVRQPAHGTLTLSGNKATYVPTKDYFSPAGLPDSFTFKVNDGLLDSALATVTLNVTPVNDKPIALGGSAIAVKNTVQEIALSATDVEDDVLSYIPATKSKKGGVVVLKANNLVSYTPKKDYLGVDSFTFTVKDSQKAVSTAATITVNVEEVKCSLPDPKDENNNVIRNLTCEDKARLNYFGVRVDPWLHSQVNADFDQTGIILEEYSKEGVNRAIDINPIISQLQAFDALIDANEANVDDKAFEKHGKLVMAFLKEAQTVINANVYFEGNAKNTSEAAVRANIIISFVEALLDTALKDSTCVAFLEKKTTKSSSCITSLSSALTSLQKVPGMEKVKFSSPQKMKASFEAFVNLIATIGAAYDYTEAFTVKEKRKAAWGLAGSIVAVLRSSISLSYAGAERTEGIPANEVGYWMASALENVATPFINIAKNCDGVSIETEELPKCFSTMAQEVGKQALNTTIAIMGNIQMIRTISDMNESLVTSAVLKEFLLAGAANHKAVYIKYGVPYNSNGLLDFISGGRENVEFLHFGALIEAIGKKKFGFTGMAAYDPWFVWAVSKQAFSIEDVRSSVAYYYSRIVNETPMNFNSPDIFLFSSSNVRGEAAITVEFNAADIRVKKGSLVCFNEDSDHTSENPLRHLLYFGDTPTREFTLKFARTASSWVRCNLYSVTGIYLGSKSIPVSIEGYDNDGDEMLDQWEIDKGFDPKNPADAAEDKDADGLSNLEEFKHNTNPKEADTDGDNFTDKQEVDAGTNPLDGTKYPSTLTAPQNLHATPGDGTVTLSWDAVPNAASYRVCLAGQHSDAGGTTAICLPNVAWGDYSNWWDAVSSTTATLKTLPDGSTPLINGTAYKFQVLAQAADGSKSPFSAEVSATPQKITSGATGKLNDTGITTCADNYQNNLPCPQAGFAGQDAEFGRDANQATNNDADGHAGFSFTKISSTGAELPSTASEWSCVKDNVTGLMWEVKTDDGGLHDKDWTYTWYELDETKNGGFAGRQNEGSCGSTSQCDTTGYVSSVNTATWCGVNDWRMPTHQELLSIVNFDKSDLLIDPLYFPNTQPVPFWSSSPAVLPVGYDYTYDQGTAKVVSFGTDGVAVEAMKGANFSVRLVRGGQ